MPLLVAVLAAQQGGGVQIHVSAIASRRRGLGGLVANPMTSGILAALLVADALALGASNGAGDSIGGSWIASRVLRRSPPARPWFAFQEGVIERPGGKVVLFDSWGIPAIEPGDVFLSFEGAPPDQRSLWAVTHEHRQYRIAVTAGSSLPEAQKGEGRRRMAEALVGAGRIPAEIGGALAERDIDRTEHFILGYAHNGAALVVLGGLVLSLSWIPPWVRKARAARARARGRCPACGYSLAGLEAGVCPECGGPLSA